MKKVDILNSPKIKKNMINPTSGYEHERLLFLQRKLNIFKENTEESFILLDRNLKIVSFNKLFHDLYSQYLHKEVVVGASILEYSHEKSQEDLKLIYEKVLNGETQQAHIEIELEENDFIVFENKYKPAIDEFGKIIGVFVISNNITKKIKSDRLLQESEARFRALIENSSEMIVLSNNEGKLTYLSPSFERITGYKIEESVGRHVTEFLVPDFIENANQLFQDLIQNPGKTFRCLSKIKCKNGSLAWLDGTITNLLHDKNVQGIVSNYRDITESRLAEIKIKESEKRFRDIVEQYPLPVITYTPTGVFTSANAALSTFWGNSLAPSEGKYNIRNDKKMQEAGMSEYIEKAFSGEVVTTPVFEYNPRLTVKSNKRRWIQIILYPLKNDQDQITEVIQITQDYTDKKEAEERIKASEIKFRYLFENSREMLFLSDESLGFSYVSPAFESITGIPVLEILGKRGLTIVQPEFQDEVNRISKDMLSNPGKVFDLKFQIQCISGELKWVEGTTVNLLHIPEIKSIVTNFRDITNRVKSEKKIQESENRFRSMIEQYPMPVAMYDSQGKFLSTNSAWEVLWEDKIENVLDYNIRKDEILIRSGLSVFVDKAYSGEVATTPVFEYDPKMIGKSGKKRWIQLIIYPLINKENIITEVVMITQDHTFNKEAEENLAKSEARFKALILNSHDGICQLASDGTLIYMSPSGKRILGYDISEFEGKVRPDLIHEEDIQGLGNAFNEVLQNPERVVRYEYRYLHPDGQIHWIETNFQNQLNDSLVASIVNTFRDITFRKKTEQEIIKLNTKLKSAQEIASLGYWEIHLQGGDNFLSDEIYTICELTSTESSFSFEEFKALISPKDIDRFIENHEKLFKTGTPFKAEYRMVLRNKKQKVVLSTGNLVQDQQGRPLLIEGTLQDITQLKKTEKELRKLNSQLQMRAKELAISNSELEQFAYIASHDLQEPLRMVTSFLTQLEKKYAEKLDDKAKQYIYFATDGAVRMRKIILDLLEFSRIGKSEFEYEDVDINELLLEAIKLNKNLIDEKQAIITYDTLPILKIQRTPLLQVFQNLLGNSLKYIQNNAHPIIHIGIVEEKDRWIFSVKDNGIGIHEQFFDKIFILFQRLHNRDEYSGTGIGLAICKKIIENYGGKIWVNSEEGKGAIFYFSIPKGIDNHKTIDV